MESKTKQKIKKVAGDGLECLVLIGAMFGAGAGLNSLGVISLKEPGEAAFTGISSLVITEYAIDLFKHYKIDNEKYRKPSFTKEVVLSLIGAGIFCAGIELMNNYFDNHFGYLRR